MRERRWPGIAVAAATAFGFPATTISAAVAGVAAAGAMVAGAVVLRKWAARVPA